MKKFAILPALAVLISFSSVNAQISKKDILLGGTFGFGSSNTSGGNTGSNTNISPRIGYAIGNNSVLSLRLGFSVNNTKSDYSRSKYTSFTTGLSWKKFIPIQEKIGWYTDLYGLYSFGSNRVDNTFGGGVNKTTSAGVGAGINPGIYFKALPRLLISADFGGLAYSYSKNNASGQDSYHSSYFNVNFLNYFSFGVDFILGKKKN